MSAAEYLCKNGGKPNETTIVFAGDILFDDHYAVKVKMNQRGRGIEGSISQECWM